MKLKTRLMLFTAALALSAGMARAAITGNDVVRSYQEAAYSHIEVKEGPTQIKVEAIKDGVVIEVVYDKVSGEVIKTESRNASADETGRTGVELRTTREDFIGAIERAQQFIHHGHIYQVNLSHRLSAAWAVLKARFPSS